ncbi:hypothetical protein B0H10DRAFT_2059683 [Mycena sp. CBHHK59/15]|nr:hypothetical protein B0H10DRAFT_2059683 [Mycena sp. CBHHK59/15]
MRICIILFAALMGLSFVCGLRNVTLDDNDSAIIYSLGWNISKGNNSMDFGGSLHFSGNLTASASLTFRGVAVYLMAPFFSSSVGVQVEIDAFGTYTLDLEDYALPADPGLGREALQSQIVWSATNLSDSQHTIVISLPPTMGHVVLDGLVYTEVESADNAASLSTGASGTSSNPSQTTSTTTTVTLSSSSSIIRSTLASSSTSKLSTSTLPSSTSAASHLTDTPANAISASRVSASVVSVPSAPPVKDLSSNLKHTIVIGSACGAIAIILVLVAILLCVRRRRMQKRSQRLEYTWSSKFTPFPSHAARIASRPPRAHSPSPRSNPPRSPFQYEHSPTTAAPLLPETPPTRRLPRSPLATAVPIMPSSPSPSAQTEFTVPSSPLPATPLPSSPLPATPLPTTPASPWSTHKSSRLSGASSIASGSGYGWTSPMPSLVGIHPFSAPSSPEPPASRPLPSPRGSGNNRALVVPSAELKMRISEAPTYHEKDRNALAHGRPRASSQVSELAPPVYSP